MFTLRSLFPALACAGALAAPSLHAQIVRPDGTPDPSYPNLWSWFDAEQGVNSSPAPLPDGTPVTRWDDRSVYGRHLTRVSSDTTRLPTAADNLASCGPTVRFDGNDYVWSAANDYGRLTLPRTIFVVARIDQADGGYLFDSSTSSGRTTLHSGEQANPGLWHSFWGDATQPSPNGAIMVSAPVDTGRYQIHTLTIGPGQQDHYVNGVPVASANDPNVFNMGGMLLGARYTTSNGLIGEIREVLVYSEVVSNADLGALIGYLVQRHPYGHGESYGSGCAGSPGTAPGLAAVGCPSPGASFGLQLTGGAANAAGVVNFALQRSNLPIGPCTVLAAPIALALPIGTDPNGELAVTITIPSGFATNQLALQALLIDIGGNPLNIAASNGVELNIF